jgi:hypothetical protein
MSRPKKTINDQIVNKKKKTKNKKEKTPPTMT